MKFQIFHSRHIPTLESQEVAAVPKKLGCFTKIYAMQRILKTGVYKILQFSPSFQFINPALPHNGKGRISSPPPGEVSQQLKKDSRGEAGELAQICKRTLRECSSKTKKAEQ